MRELGRRSEPAKVPFRKSEDDWVRSFRAKSADTDRESDPLVTTHRVGQRIEIAAVCPTARALGLQPGMPLTKARILVPGLDVRGADFVADASLLTRIALFAARRWTPCAAVAAPHSLWLDLTGVTHLFGGEQRMCERILRFCARLGLSARIAVAGSYGAAHALARFGGSHLILCPFGTEAAALSPLPIAALRLDEDALGAAQRFGIQHIGELCAMPRAPLQRRFGRLLLERLDQALGRVDEPFDPVIPADMPYATLGLLEPIATAEAIGQVVGELLAELIDRLARRGLAARRLALICDRVDGKQEQLRIGTARATRDNLHLFKLLSAKIESIEPGFGIEAMHLVADRYEPLGPQMLEGKFGGEKTEPNLEPLLDRLALRIGMRLFKASAVESDVPERSVRRISPLASTDEWPDWPRPIRLLPIPEPVEKVLAELPDQAPRRFNWRGKTYVVRKSDGPERIYGEWWKRSGEADAVRDYFQVEDEEGRRFWLYRRGDGLDSRTGDLSWWLQGAFG